VRTENTYSSTESYVQRISVENDNLGIIWKGPTNLITIQQASCQRSGEMSSSSSSYLSSEGAGFSWERPGSGGGEGDIDCVGESPAKQRWREFRPSQGSCPLLKARERLWSPQYAPRTRGDRFALAKRYARLHIDRRRVMSVQVVLMICGLRAHRGRPSLKWHKALQLLRGKKSRTRRAISASDHQIYGNQEI